LLFSATGIADAQNTVTPQQNATSNAAFQNAEATAEPANSDVRILAGCLEKGPGANVYTLHGESPNLWLLRSEGVYLAAYVDETVRITVVKKPDSDGVYFVTDVLSVTITSCIR
jgi:hypothetical protein